MTSRMEWRAAVARKWYYDHRDTLAVGIAIAIGAPVVLILAKVLYVALWVVYMGRGK